MPKKTHVCRDIKDLLRMSMVELEYSFLFSFKKFILIERNCRAKLLSVCKLDSKSSSNT